MKFEAYLCNLAYNNPEIIIRQLEKKGIYNVKILEVENTFGITFLYNHKQYICFRGSNDIQDWIANLDYGMHNFWLGKVHSGFYDLARKIVVEVQVKCIKGVQTIVCGHSLGGALAVLMPLMLKTCNIPIISVRTFGQPRVFDQEAINNLKDSYPNYVRVINNIDGVPDIPISNKKLFGYKKEDKANKKRIKYKHFGKVIYIDRKDKVHNNLPDFFRSWDRIKSWVTMEEKAEFAKDHDMNRYCQLLDVRY